MATQSSFKSRGKFRGNRRRKHIVNATFQWKCVGSIMAIVFAVSAMITVVTYGVIYQSVRTATLHGSPATFASSTLSLVLCGLGFAIVPALALGFWSIFVSHRICGPLYAMEKDLREIAEGRFPEQRPLRKKDHFKPFHAELWRALTALKKRDDRYRDTLSEISRLVTASTNQPDGTQRGALSDIAAQLAPFVDDLEKSPAVSPESESKASSPTSKASALCTETVETAC